MYLTVGTRLLAILGLSVLIPVPALAIDYLVERPIVILSLEYQDKDEKRSGPGVAPRSEQTNTFWQRLELRSRGWLYHPDLMLYSFGLEPQWKQQDTAASGMFNRDDDDNFLGYFLDAQVAFELFDFFIAHERPPL